MSLNSAGVFKISKKLGSTVSTAITILQVKAGSANPIEIIRAYCFQETSNTSAMQPIQLLRKSAAATVTAAVSGDVASTNPSGGTSNIVLSTSGSGYIATAEGTDSTVYDEAVFNMLNGYLYLPVPEERFIVPASGIVALKLTAAPSATTFHVGMVWQELG